MCNTQQFLVNNNIISSNNNNNNNNREGNLCSWMQVSALPEGKVCIALTLSGIAERILVYSDFYYEAETG